MGPKMDSSKSNYTLWYHSSTEVSNKNLSKGKRVKWLKRTPVNYRKTLFSDVEIKNGKNWFLVYLVTEMFGHKDVLNHQTQGLEDQCPSLF